MLVLILLFVIERRQRGNGGEVEDVFERRYFPPEKEGGDNVY